MENYKIQYPLDLAPRGQQIDEYISENGSIVKVCDPYRFLEDPDSEETKIWNSAQNKLTSEYLNQCDLREKIKLKLTQIQSYAKMSLPQKHGDYFYFRFNSGLQDQALVHKVKINNLSMKSQIDPNENTEIFMDPNTLAEDGTAALSQMIWSKNGKYMAYTIQRAGSDWAEIYVRDSQTGLDLVNDRLMWAKFTHISWLQDGFFYSAYDPPTNFNSGQIDMQRDGPQKVFYHRIGQKQNQDQIIYQQNDEPDWIYVATVTTDDQFLIIDKRGDCDDDLGQVITYANIRDEKFNHEIQMREIKFIHKGPNKGGMVYICNYENLFYFMTNINCSKRKVIQIDINNPSQDLWKDIIPEHPYAVMTYCKKINQKMIVLYMENASEKISIYNFNKNEAQFLQDIQLPGIGTIIETGSVLDQNLFTFKFMSFTDPGSIYTVNLDNLNEMYQIYSTKLCDLKVEQYITDQIWISSKDGTKIPMFVVRKKTVLPSMDFVPDNPILTQMYGYGGFNVSITPTFNANRLVLLNNLGGLLVVVTLRGGGEFGEEWHSQGMLDKKQNVFDDFIAAAEYLIEKKYTDPNHLTMNGGSNGGLLVAACANQRPDLFAVGIAQVPVCDMLRFQKFTDGYQWCSDYGNSENQGDVDYLLKYSPLHNVKPQKYPAMLVCTADHDDRVVPLHSLKYIAELQFQAGQIQDQRPLLCRIEINAGHGGGIPTTKTIQLYTDIFGFISKITNTKWQD